MIYKNWAAAMSSRCGHSLLGDYGPPVWRVAPQSTSEGATKRRCVIEEGGLSETVVFGRTPD